MVKPGTIEEALSMRIGRVPLAGGTDLMVKGFDREPLYIGHLEAIKGIRFKKDSIIIGAATTLNEILPHPLVPTVLKQAIHLMASPGIRSMATIGGNVCNSSPAGDTLPPLYLLDAQLILVSKGGERSVPVDRFIKGPGENTMGEDELLKEIVIPLNNLTGSGFRKVGTRNALALSKASIAFGYKLEKGRLLDIRISLGAVAPTPIRSKSIEGFLVETYPWSEEDIGTALEGYNKLIQPITDQRSTAEYRRWVSLSLIKWFLEGVGHGNG